MILLIAGFIIGFLGVTMTFVYMEFSYMLVFMVGLIIVAICTNQPLSGWKKGKILEEHQLLPIIPKSKVYLLISEKGDMMYKYKDGNEEIIKCSSCHDTLYKEIDNDKRPCFKVQKLKAKKSLWACPVGLTKWQNILYVPKGSIEE